MELVTAEEEAQYTRYIDDILNEVNLETVTRKAIRAELENKLGGKDLTEQKVCGPAGSFTPRGAWLARGLCPTYRANPAWKGKTARNRG